MSKTIGITLGDQAGIGPEIIQAAINDERLGQWLKEDIGIRIIGNPLSATLGKPSLATARAALDALHEGAQLARSGEIDAIVTAPVAKEWLHQVGFNYPGQTEFFADQLDCSNYAMCLSGEHLTVALVTIHLPISAIPEHLNEQEIIRVGGLLKDFCSRANHTQPRIAVCGLNPHAGEHGAFGNEEIEIIAPAIQSLNKAHTSSTSTPIFSGPYPPDAIFRKAAQGAYDSVLCMYHDQGLIPLKLLDFDTGVNTTLGLRIPRTSPDHGTAFDIAGKNLASHESMLHAIKLAAKLIS